MGNCIGKNKNISEETILNKQPIKKTAILVGLNYLGTNAALNGCINDANGMKNILRSKYGYKDIKVLTDKNISKTNNILDILEALIESKSDIMYFQYSGHGTQIYDLGKDEKDGLDEALYSVGGTIITDDEIEDKIKLVPAGSTMIMVVDACHSGTIIDLPYQMDNNNNNIIKINNNQIDGNIICITGCRDNQFSLDVKQNNIWYGAMSNSLQKIIKNNNIRNFTWKKLIVELRKSLKEENYHQVPQLCVSRKELINQKVNL